MGRYAVENKIVSEAVDGGGLLVVAQWEAKPGEADKVAAISIASCPRRNARTAPNCS